MYNDYDVAYKSNINEFLIYWIILGVICVLLITFTFISLSRVFKKANRSGIAAFIPFYNLYLLVEIANLPKYYFVLILIPIINIPFIIKMNIEIAKLFKKKPGFGLGITFLPFIYYPILAFSFSEYIGINIVAMNSKKSVEKIAVIDDNKQKEIEKEVNEEEDIASRNVNISIGGGKYQKDYQNNVSAIDETKLLYKNKKIKQERVDLTPKQNVFITEEPVTVELEEKKEEPTVFSVPFINEVEKKEELIKEQSIENKKTIQTNSNEPVDLLKSTRPKAVENNGIKTCPNCGTRVLDNAKICMICGQPLE